MKTIMLLILTLLVNVSFGQSEKIDSKVLGDAFEEKYNADDFEGIFSMFGASMAEALPLDKTTQFLAGLKMQVGKILVREFTKYEQSYATYKTTFERGIFNVNISIDKDSKINGLYVKPDVEEPSSEKVINDLSSADRRVSKEQADLIFNTAKNFPAETQLAFAIIKDGEVSYYGVHRTDDRLSKIDNQESSFEIGSISKVFTSTLLAGMVIEQKMDLDEQVSNYVNLKNNAKISVQQLANHTSGLPRMPSNLDLSKVDQDNPYKEYDGSDLEDYLINTLELDADRVDKFEYSNLGAGLLGHIVSKIENVSYDSLLQKRIFAKFNMLHSTASQGKVKGELVRGLDEGGQVVSNWDFLSLAGAGGILSNVEDLSRFASAQFDSSNTELKLTQQETYKQDANMSIGLGWFITTSKSGNELHWHNGGTGGYSSCMAIDIKEKDAIIILSNVSGLGKRSSSITELCFDLMSTLEK